MKPASPDAAADLSGLEAAPCDPLILAINLDDRPLRGLAGWVDWRIGGALSDLVVAGAIPEEKPLLYPAPMVLPVRRLVLWRAGAAMPADLARAARGFGTDRPGVCPADFHLDVAEVRAAFGGQVVVYG